MSKKILILAMSCNQDFFQKEEYVVRHESYAKAVLEGKYDNVDFWTYTASEDGKIHVNKNTHKIKVPADDSLYGTYQKTIMALKVLDTIGIEYDYIFRTNLSTWVNVQLLRRFVEEIPEENSQMIYSAGIYSTVDASGPEPYDLYAVGNSMLIPKFWCDVLKIVHVSDVKKYDQTEDNKPEDKKSIYNIDDNAIGFVVNVYCNLNGIDKYSVWQSFMRYMNRPGEYQKFIAIPVRIYGNESREKEFDSLRAMTKGEQEMKFPDESGAIYKYETLLQYIQFINFGKNESYMVEREQALEFLKNKDKYNNDIGGYVQSLKHKF